VTQSRIFTFGCSFTQYFWPTWADMICYKNDGYNFGQKGGGTTQILHKVANANRKYNFTELDKIIIMLPSLFRHDKIDIHNGKTVWVCNGSQYENPEISNDWMFTQSLNDIIFLKEYLEANELFYWFTAMHDIFNSDFVEYQDLSEQQLEHLNYVSEHIDFKYPTMLESLVSIPNEWGSRNPLYTHGGSPDLHPTILEHYEYANKIEKVNIRREDILIAHHMMLQLNNVSEMNAWCNKNFNIFSSQRSNIY